MYLGPEGNRSHWYMYSGLPWSGCTYSPGISHVLLTLTPSSVQCKIKPKTHIRSLANKFTGQHLLFISPSVLVTDSGVLYDYLIVVPDAPTVKIYVYHSILEDNFCFMAPESTRNVIFCLLPVELFQVKLQIHLFFVMFTILCNVCTCNCLLVRGFGILRMATTRFWALRLKWTLMNSSTWTESWSGTQTFSGSVLVHWGPTQAK